MPETVYKAVIEAKTQEGVDILKLFADAFNKCNLVGDADVKLLIARGDEFQEGIMKLIIRLTASSKQTLKS